VSLIAARRHARRRHRGRRAVRRRIPADLSGAAIHRASRATLFIYTAPFFVALGSSVLLGESCARVQWLGLLCSFAGLVVAFGVPDPSATAAAASATS
jgi:drug/metabolite transporter (DMT)-like permease